MSFPILFTTLSNQTPAIAGIAIAGESVVNNVQKGIGFLSGTQGLGALSDCISCEVTEERNGLYELEMVYPITGIHFDEIQPRSIIAAPANYLDGLQPFRIYKITKPMNGVCTINAAHLTYDLSNYEMPPGIESDNLADTCIQLTAYANDFTITTNMPGNYTFRTDVPASVRSWLGGKEGSLLDLYGGEWHWNGYTCELLQSRGQMSDVTIRYGKNLTELELEENYEVFYTHVRAYYVDTDGTVTQGNLIGTGAALENERIYFLDCNEHFGETVPTVEQLNSYAESYIKANSLGSVQYNLDLDFVQQEEQINLCDTVTVLYEQLGISATAKCIQTVWDVLQDRFIKTTIGNLKLTLTDTILGGKNGIK